MTDFDLTELLQVLERISDASEHKNVLLERIANALDQGTVTIENNQLVAATKPLKSEVA